MNIYDRYKRLIQDKIDNDELTPEFIEETTYRLGEFFKKGKITEEEYNELITMMNKNSV